MAHLTLLPATTGFGPAAWAAKGAELISRSLAALLAALLDSRQRAANRDIRRRAAGSDLIHPLAPSARKTRGESFR